METIPGYSVDIYLGSQSKWQGERFADCTPHLHADYDSARIENDIALIELPRDVNFDTPQKRAIDLPSASSFLAEGNSLLVSGWGLTGKKLSLSILAFPHKKTSRRVSSTGTMQ